MSLGIMGHSPYVLGLLKQHGKLLNQPLETYWVYSSFRPWLTGNIRYSLDCKEAVAITCDLEATGGNCIIAVPAVLSKKQERNVEINFLSFPEIPFLTFEELWQDNLAHERDDVVGYACNSGGCPLANLHQNLRPVPGYTWTFNTGRASLHQIRNDNRIVRRGGAIPGFMSSIIDLVDAKEMDKPISYHAWEEILLLVAASYKFEIPQPVGVDPDDIHAKFIHQCGECGKLYHWSADDHALAYEQPFLPCGHDWKLFNKNFPEPAPEEPDPSDEITDPNQLLSSDDDSGYDTVSEPEGYRDGNYH